MWSSLYRDYIALFFLQFEFVYFFDVKHLFSFLQAYHNNSQDTPFSNFFDILFLKFKGILQP